MRLSTWIVAGGAIAAFAVWAMQTRAPENAAANATTQGPDGNDALVAITVPETLSESAQAGRAIYANVCASCHGENGVGRDGMAPPLIHRIYEPSHHGDESFQIAVARGVRAHHWPFGNMPPVEGLTRGDVSMIVAYIREIQRANGIR